MLSRLFKQSMASWLAALLLATSMALAFDPSSSSNFVVYWGQSSAGSQKSLSDYCQDSTVDAIALAFLYQFPNTKLDFSSACKTTFSGTNLLHCPDIAADIKTCQAKGKIVLLSMGGAAGSYGFSSDAEAKTYADTMWDMFFGGSGSQRPFDDAVLDGVDLDVEGGSTTGYAAFVTQLRTHFASGGGKQYYVSAAPQCPFPDAMLGSTLDAAYFDMVFVQFYNNYCGLDAYPQGFNYDAWDKWAKTQSPNKDVKIYIGAPGSQSAAGRGYVDASTLNTIVNSVRGSYSTLGGVMTWDASQALGSGGASSWGSSVSSNLKAGGSSSSSSSSSSSGNSDSSSNGGNGTSATQGESTVGSSTAMTTGSSTESSGSIGSEVAASSTPKRRRRL